jgi:asparagine synthase (glutamine-hydrolysing)
VPGNQCVIAASRDRGTLSDAAWYRFIRRCRSEVSRASGGKTPAVLVLADDDTALIVSGRGADRLRQAAERRRDVVVDPSSMMDIDGSILSWDRCVQAEESSSVVEALRRVMPPFGYVVRDAAVRMLSIGTDPLGLRHVYVTQGDGVALASFSSTLLGRLTDRSLDERAAGVYSQLGCFLGTRSMFDGVTKLEAGGRAHLEAGELLIRTGGPLVPTAVRASDFFGSKLEAVARGRDVLTGILDAYLSVHPEPHLELSGGLDSRLLLAMLQEMGASHVRTVTIGDESSSDYHIAGELAHHFGLKAAFVPFSRLLDWTREEATRRVYDASRDRDFASNGMSGAIHALVAEILPAEAQITGQGGELGRGSYYAGQRVQDAFNAEKLHSLVRWRLTVNQAVDASLLTETFAASAAGWVKSDAWEYVADVTGGWPAVTDQVYLFGRMQRWAGASYSKALPGHSVLAPYFHPAYVDWASRIPVELKRNSATFVSLLEDVDPRLARVPLDSGLTPQQLVDRSPMGRTRLARRNVKRAGRKVRQRISGQRHVPAGVGTLADNVVASWRLSPPVHLQRVAWLDTAAIDRVCAGAQSIDPVSVAFLVNLDAARAALEAEGNGKE